MKIVRNNCYGGFGLSKVAMDRYTELTGNVFVESERETNRTDRHLIQVVEEMGKKADGGYADLEIGEIPDGTDWYFDEYDGIETIVEIGHSW